MREPMVCPTPSSGRGLARNDHLSSVGSRLDLAGSCFGSGNSLSDSAVAAESSEQNAAPPVHTSTSQPHHCAVRRISCVSKFERELAQEGARTDIEDPACTPQAEYAFAAGLSTSCGAYVKYFLKSVLNYNAEAIIGPGVFLAAATSASVLAKKQLLRDMCLILGVSVALGTLFRLGNINFDSEDKDRLKNLVTDFQSLCTFLLGFFVNTCMTRWWAIRSDCIGVLWGCADDLSLIIGSYFWRATEEDDEVRKRVQRWSILSHELVYKQARAEDDLDDLVEREWLLQEELEKLKGETSKAQVIWAWMCSYFAHLATTNRLPFCMTVLPELHEICRRARGAIGACFAYTDTQVPFRYVHFLSLIIWMNNFFQALNSAVVISAAHLNEHYTTITVELVFLVFHPLIYLGLLHLGCGMLNPLHAKWDTDFPSGAWTYFMQAEITSLFRANIEPSWCMTGTTSVAQPSAVGTNMDRTLAATLNRNSSSSNALRVEKKKRPGAVGFGSPVASIERTPSGSTRIMQEDVYAVHE